MQKLSKEFYQRPALKIVKDFLGKYLVYKTRKGLLSGRIIDVEAYPAFLDHVSHGNKKTKRTEVMYKEGGFVYVYLIYGIHYQFAIVVNKKDIPDVVFIRAVIPDQGIRIMKNNFGKNVDKIANLTRSPGNLCKSFGIDLSLYGKSVTGNKIWIEDRGCFVPEYKIQSATRIGINKNIEGNDKKFRYYMKLP